MERKALYESPKATFVPMQLGDRLMGCGFYSYCGSPHYV